MILKPVKCCIGYKTTNRSETITKIHKIKIDKFSFLYFDILIFYLFEAVKIKNYKKFAYGINAPLEDVFYFGEYINKSFKIKKLKDVLKENIKELNNTIKLDYFEGIGIDYYLIYRNILKRLYNNLKRNDKATIIFKNNEYKLIMARVEGNASANIYYQKGVLYD